MLFNLGKIHGHFGTNCVSKTVKEWDLGGTVIAWKFQHNVLCVVL